MDGRGQISVEYILFVGFVLIIILLFANVIGDQQEQNNVAVAARTGAINATAQMEITNSGMFPLRVNEVNTTGTNPINIVIYLSGSITNSQKVQILTSTNKSIASLGYSPIYDGNSGTNQITLNTTRHNYKITLS